MGTVISSFSGVMANTFTVLLGSLLGLAFKKKLPEKLSKSIMTVIGLCTVVIGVKGVLEGKNQLVMIISLVIGTVIGTLINIDKGINKLGDKLKTKNNEGSTFTEGFVTSSLLFCIGAMTIVGSINAGINGNNEMLYTKSILDFISSIMLSASLGIGVLFSAIFVFLFQGALVGFSMLMGSFLSDFQISELICAGSVMIIALGLNLIGVTKIKVANMLPALIFVPLLCLLF